MTVGVSRGALVLVVVRGGPHGDNHQAVEALAGSRGAGTVLLQQQPLPSLLQEPPSHEGTRRNLTEQIRESHGRRAGKQALTGRLCLWAHAHSHGSS